MVNRIDNAYSADEHTYWVKILEKSYDELLRIWNFSTVIRPPRMKNELNILSDAIFKRNY